MPTITYDGRSFMLDGRRTWFVTAGVHHQRFEPDEWGDRLRQAKFAGFNTIETPVFWNACEVRPGKLEFSGRNDLAQFAGLVDGLGMKLILRVGPYVGSGWDLGGLPAWLMHKDETRLRSTTPGFLEASGKYLSALAKVIKPLQVTEGGPLALIQIESNWTCADPDFRQGYLAELSRFLRESGVSVPRINSNNLWLGAEGDVDGWVGAEGLLPIVRQLGAVRPAQPRMVVDFGFKTKPVFGLPEPELVSGIDRQRRLAEVLASCGQFNVSPLISGRTPGFWGGQASAGSETMLAPVQDLGSAVDEVGRTRESFGPTRRIASFASSFGRVFAALDPEYAPVVAEPGSTAIEQSAKRGSSGGAWCVAHVRGQQGSVIFLFSPDGGAGKPGTTHLLLPDGTPLSMPTGSQSVYWSVLDATLSSRSTLDSTSFCPLAHEGDVLVLFGPEGSEGVVTINGTPVDLEVPKSGHIAYDHEGVLVVLVGEKLVDQTAIHDDAVYVGVSGFAEDGTPLAVGSARSCIKITEGAEETKVSFSRARLTPLPKDKRAPLGAWKAADTEPYTGGGSPRFAQIAGPSDLFAMGCTLGYGWYKIAVRSGATKKVKLASPASGDRLQVFIDGESQGMLGRGPGAAESLSVSLKKGTHTICALADNMGRVSGGSDMYDAKGLLDHLYDVAPLKLGKAKVTTAEPVDLLSFRKPLFWTRAGDTSSPYRVTWAFQHRRSSPIFIVIPPAAHRMLVLLNEEPIAFADAHAGLNLTLDAERGLKRGNNTFEVVLAPDTDDPELNEALAKELASTLASEMRVLEGTAALTQKGDWAFAKWERPAATKFKEQAKTSLGKAAGPTWWKSTFEVIDRPGITLAVDLSGMTKGQLYINGHDLGRYFVHTHEGKAVPPIASVTIPAPIVREGANEIVLFDEHGGNPSKLRVVYVS